jgi:hypothetical protein
MGEWKKTEYGGWRYEHEGHAVEVAPAWIVLTEVTGEQGTFKQEHVDTDFEIAMGWAEATAEEMAQAAAS